MHSGLLFRLAGKKEKKTLSCSWCVLRVRFRQAPIFQSLRTRKLTLRALWYAAHRKKARCPGALGVFRYTLSLCRGGRLCPPTESSVFRESTADSQFPEADGSAYNVRAFRTPPGSGKSLYTIVPPAMDREHTDGDEFQTACIDHGAHDHRIPEGKAGCAHRMP